MNKPLQLSQSSSEDPPNFLTFSLLPELLPIGKENKTELYLGIKTDSDGNSSVIKVNVWRTKNHVYCECKHETRRKAIVSESEKVFMTLSCCYQPTIEISESYEGLIRFNLLPNLLHSGSEDRAQIKLAIGVGENKNSEVKLNVWREGDTVRCEHTKYKEYKSSVDIKSDTEEVETF